LSITLAKRKLSGGGELTEIRQAETLLVYELGSGYISDATAWSSGSLLGPTCRSVCFTKHSDRSPALVLFLRVELKTDRLFSRTLTLCLKSSKKVGMI